MSLDANAIAKNLTIVMEVEAANHPVDRGVMGVGVPTTSVSLTINDARRGRQPNALEVSKEVPMQFAITSRLLANGVPSKLVPIDQAEGEEAAVRVNGLIGQQGTHSAITMRLPSGSATMLS
jgi:hypothetical protein